MSGQFSRSSPDQTSGRKAMGRTSNEPYGIGIRAAIARASSRFSARTR